MRRRGTTTLALGLTAVVAAGAWGGCTATKPTELVPGVSSQVQVPRNLAAVTVEVQVNGAQTFCNSYPVNNGLVDLPRTLGVVQASPPDTAITITIRGYDDPGFNVAMNGGTDAFCADNVSGDGGVGSPRILRRSVQTYVSGHELFVPMPLRYSCYDTDCSANGATSTCKGAQCVDGTEDAGALVDFTPALVSGEDEPCFHADECFEDAVPAVPVDAQNCVYQFLEGKPPGSGLNVRVFYEDRQATPDNEAPLGSSSSKSALVSGGEVEILDSDPVEGFTVVSPDGGALPQFQLAPGLCRLAHQATTPPASADGGTASGNYITITDVQVASVCPPKPPLLPICAGDRTTLSKTNLPLGSFTPDGQCNVARTLSPSPTALYLLVDNSSYMFNGTSPTDGGAGVPVFGPQGQATFLTLFLSNPMFSRTFLAQDFLTHATADCTQSPTSYSAPDSGFALAKIAAPGVESRLAGLDAGVGNAPLELEAAMRPDAGAYAALTSAIARSVAPQYNTQAVAFFVNRAPGAAIDGECTDTDGGPAANEAAAEAQLTSEVLAAAGQGIQTFFVVFGSDASVVAAYDAVATAARGTSAASPVQVIDLTSGSASGSLENFAKVVEPLATCVYDLPVTPAGVTAPDWASATLSYKSPVAPPGPGVTVPHVQSCSPDAGSASGWALETVGTNTQRVRVCGQACSDLQNLIVQAALYVLLQQNVVTDGGLAGVPGSTAQRPFPWLDVPVTLTPNCPASATDGG